MNLYFVHRIATFIALVTGVSGLMAAFVAYETREKSHKAIAVGLLLVCFAASAIAIAVTTQTESFQQIGRAHV